MRIDPGFSSRIDPGWYGICAARDGHGQGLGLSLSGSGGGRAGSEAEAVIACFEDVAMMGQSVQQGCGHLGITEDAGPFTEAQVGGDDDAGALVKLAEQMEQRGPA